MKRDQPFGPGLDCLLLIADTCVIRIALHRIRRTIISQVARFVSLPLIPLHTMPSSPLINVVVIGAGLAGAGVVDALASKLPKTHRLVVISETEAAFYPIAALRGAVVKGQLRYLISSSKC